MASEPLRAGDLRLLTKEELIKCVEGMIAAEDLHVVEIERLRKALGGIADQMGCSEMSYADGRHADFEGAYDTMIDIARAALATKP